MKVTVALAQIPFQRRATEALAEELCAALKAAGHLADIVRVPFKWNPPERLSDHLLATRLLDLEEHHSAADLLIALEFPAYLVRHPRKVLWLTHLRRGFTEITAAMGPPKVEAERLVPVIEICREADACLGREMRGLFAISVAAAYQLRASAGLDATVLSPPPRRATATEPPPASADYLLVSAADGARSRWELALEALALTRSPVRLRFCGVPEGGLEPLAARAAELGLGNRVKWWGKTSELELRRQIASCRAVVHPAFMDTFGTLAHEAMLARKPLVTCFDSGAPAELVEPEETGLLVGPSPAELAVAMDELTLHPDRARVWGAGAWERAAALGTGWPQVIEALLSEPADSP